MKNDAILEMGRARMREAVDWDVENREDALDDLKVLSGDQWPDDIRKEREGDNKPCLTINQLPQFLRQVTGDIRKLNPALKVIASDTQSAEETAEIIGGLVRSIEYGSDAPSIYERAAESAAACGIGAWRILTEYENDNSFNQVIKLQNIHNPLAVYWDPASRMSTREDARYCFITDMMKLKDFKEEYPNATTNDAEYDGSTDGLEYWREEGQVVVAEYIWREPKEVTIGVTASGETIEDPKPFHDVQKTRKVTKHEIKWAKISGTDVLEGPQSLPGKYIPVVSVTGEELHIGERIVRTSVIRHAKDPQRLYNYSSSTHAEIVSIQPRAPYMVTLKQVQGLETFWKEANKSNRPYLPYNPDEKAPGAPKRESPPVYSQGLMSEIDKAQNDLRSTTGIYDTALGQKSNETSGVAIRQRQIESDVSTSIYTDNLRKAIEHNGRIILSMIPEVYDTQREIRVMAADDEEKIEQVNVPYAQLNGLNQLETGFTNDITQGEFDVRVTVGPSYSTQRQEAVEGLLEFIRAVPQAAPIAGDIIARNLDFPGAEELAERLKATIPPEVIQEKEPTPEQQQAAQMAAQEAERQKAIQGQALAIELKETSAKADKAEADAGKARADALKTGLEAEDMRLEMAAKSGQLDMLVRQAVQQAIQGVF